MRSVTAIMLCCGVVAGVILSGCAEPKPPTLQSNGGYVLTCKITDKSSDLSPQELKQRITDRIRGYCQIKFFTVDVDQASIRIELPGANEQSVEECQDILLIPGNLSLHIVAEKQHDDLLFAAAENEENLTVTTPAGKTAIWTRCAPKLHFSAESTRVIDGQSHLLLIQQQGDLTGADFKDFSESVDDNGSTTLEFVMTPQGANRLGRLTSDNFERHLALVFDHTVVSGPTIFAKITDRGVITGDFPEAEFSKLLRIGKLATFGEIPQLELISSQRVSPMPD